MFSWWVKLERVFEVATTQLLVIITRVKVQRDRESAVFDANSQKSDTFVSPNELQELLIEL